MVETCRELREGASVFGVGGDGEVSQLLLDERVHFGFGGGVAFRTELACGAQFLVLWRGVFCVWLGSWCASFRREGYILADCG